MPCWDSRECNEERSLLDTRWDSAGFMSDIPEPNVKKLHSGRRDSPVDVWVTRQSWRWFSPSWRWHKLNVQADLQYTACLAEWRWFNSGSYKCFLLVLSRRRASSPLNPTPALVSAVCFCFLPFSKILHFAIWEGVWKKRSRILSFTGGFELIFVTS